MPLAFPSHQGLIAPLWRRWPHRFDVPALCIGAAMPDVIDGIAGAFRGQLGQWYGHTLIGLFLLAAPAGFLLERAVILFGVQLDRRGLWPGVAGWILIAQHRKHTPAARAWRSLESMFIGGFSHLFFDFISHGNFLWFYPWYENPHFFPAWWYMKWFEIPLPGYRNPYPAGPHLLVWIFLSLLGTAMLFWPWWRLHRDQSDSRDVDSAIR